MAFHSYIVAAGFHTRVDAIEAMKQVVAEVTAPSLDEEGCQIYHWSQGADVSARPSHDQIHRELVYRSLQFQKVSQLFMSAHDEPLSVAMRVLLALSAVVENGYDR
jgi:uncharacterized protein YggL (DUF469 family)